MNIRHIIILLLLFCNISKAQELEAYLQIAAENNPEVQSAYTQFEVALQQSPQVGSLPDPTLTLSSFGRMMETRLGAQQARFSLMQMFPWFGTLKGKKEAAELLAEARFQEYLVIRANLFFEIKKAYAELFAVEQTIGLKEKNLEILDSYRKLSLSKFRSGSSKMVNVVQVDIRREEALTEIALEKDQLESLQKQFNLLLNRDPAAEVVIEDTLIFNRESLREIINSKEAINEHPELIGMDKQLEAYQNRAETAKKSGLPTIGFGVDYAIISERTDANPPRNGQDAVMPMFSVSLPIFRKKYKAAKKEAELMQKAVIQSKRARQNKLQSELESTCYDLKKADKLLKLYQRQLESSTRANELLISAFSNNNGDFEDVLQMNQDILRLETEQINALKAGFTAQARMDYLSAKTEKYDEKN